MGICSIEQASESARKEAKSDVIVTSSPERVPDRSPGPFLCVLMGAVLPLENLASTFRFDRSWVIVDTRAGERRTLQGGRPERSSQDDQAHRFFADVEAVFHLQ